MFKTMNIPLVRVVEAEPTESFTFSSSLSAPEPAHHLENQTEGYSPTNVVPKSTLVGNVIRGMGEGTGRPPT